jgi:hypothetical protein
LDIVFVELWLATGKSDHIAAVVGIPTSELSSVEYRFSAKSHSVKGQYQKM